MSHVHPPSDAKLEHIGGMQTVSIELLNRLQNSSQVSVFPLLLESPAQGIEMRVAKFMGWLFLNLPRIVARERADLILFSSMVTASLSILLRNQIQIPMVAINHGKDTIVPIVPYQKILPTVFNCLDGVISVSQATQKATIHRGLQPEKSVVLPNGIKIENRVYDKNRSRSIIEKMLNFKFKNKYILLSVGRQVKRKGHAWFIETVFPLLERNVIFLAIGEGKERENLQNLKRQSPFGDRIILPGKVAPDLLRHAYDAADIFMMPNIPVTGDMEGFGVVILEANEARTPVVASDLEGIRDVVCDGRNGYRIQPYDAHQFARVIGDILDSKLEYLSESAYQFAIENFAWETLGDRYIECLQKIAAKSMIRHDL